MQIICLMGPTGVGKTQVALESAQILHCPLISVDSAMVYRGMNIGTAKPSADLLKRFPHYLIDICDPQDTYSVADFCDDALRYIEQCVAQGNPPLLVGGTMLYFKALQEGLSSLPQAEPKIRHQLLLEAEEKGWEALYSELQKVDPLAATRIHPNDRQRLQRALEVYRLTGKTISTLQSQRESQFSLAYDWLNIVIEPPSRDILRERLAQRFHTMLQEGLIEEVQQLLKDKDPTLPALRSVGYRQVCQFLMGEYDYETMVERAITASRQLAKRQLTWLRHWPNCHWLSIEEATAYIIKHYHS